MRALARPLTATQKTARVPFGSAWRVPKEAATTPAHDEEAPSRTVLPGGVTVLTLGEALPETTLSLYVRAGTRYETRNTVGATQFLRHFAFRSSQDKSALRLVRDLEHVGGSLAATYSRERLAYHVRGARVDEEGVRVPVMIESLRAVTSPLLLEHEVHDTRRLVSRESSKADALQLMVDRAHFEAFGDSGLANPLIAPEHVIASMSGQRLHRHVADWFYPGERMLLVGTGISHARLVEEAQRLFADARLRGHFPELESLKPLPHVEPVPQSARHPTAPVLARTPRDGPTRLLVAYSGRGLTHADSAAVAVIRELLGGSAAITASTGSTLHRTGRLGQEVDTCEWLQSARAHTYTYSDAGLLAVYAEADAGHGKSLQAAVRAQIQGVATNLKPEELERAKSLAKGALRQQQSSRLGLVDAIADLHFAGGKNQVRDVVGTVDKVSKEDVARVAKDVFSSAPVIVVDGDVRGIQL